jgi:hypothetical protein
MGERWQLSHGPTTTGKDLYDAAEAANESFLEGAYSQTHTYPLPTSERLHISAAFPLEDFGELCNQAHGPLGSLSAAEDKKSRSCTYFTIPITMEQLSQVFRLLYSLRYQFFGLILFVFIGNQYISYRRLSHIKGPRLAAWSSLWLIGVAWRRKMCFEFFDVYKSYGR